MVPIGFWLKNKFKDAQKTGGKIFYISIICSKSKSTYNTIGLSVNIDLEHIIDFQSSEYIKYDALFAVINTFAWE